MDIGFPLIEACKEALNSMVNKAERTPSSNISLAHLIDSVSPFDARRVPRISVSAYVSRLQNFAHCSDSCHVIALLYIDRMIQKSSVQHLTLLNIHR